MKKLIVIGIAAAGFIGFSVTDSIRSDTVRGLGSIASKNSLGLDRGTATFYDSSRMSNLAESLGRVEQGDKITITPSNIDIVARRMLSFTTEYAVVRSPDQNDPLLTIQVKPQGSEIIKTMHFEDWKQFILNDREVNFEPKRLLKSD